MEKKTDFTNFEGKTALGKTGIFLSPLGFGCAGAWGKSVLGKPMISQYEAQALFERAYELGIRYFDTGHNYGFAEERIGRILKESSVVKREDIVISTKFGERAYNGDWLRDFSPKWMKESVALSLKRMGIDYIDLLMCHGGEISDLSPELFEALGELKQKGIIRAVGINTFTDDVIKYVKETGCFDFVMLDYNILRQDREPVIKELYERGIGVIAGAALGEGLYMNSLFKIRRRKDLWYLARAFMRFKQQLKTSRNFRFLNNAEGISSAQAALKYVLNNRYITSAVFQTTSLKHLEENAAALNAEVPQEVFKMIKAKGETNYEL